MKDVKYGHLHDEDGDPIGGEEHDADEPAFVLRAQDKAAPMTVRIYAQHAASHGANEQFVQSVHDAANAMEAWQEANPDKVGTPD